MNAWRGAVVAAATLLFAVGCWNGECERRRGDDCPDASKSLECTFDTCTIDYATGASTRTDLLRIEEGAVLHIRAQLPARTRQIRMGIIASGVSSLTLTIDGVSATRLEPAVGTSPNEFAFAVPAPPPTLRTVTLDVALPDAGGHRGGIDLYVRAMSQQEECRICAL